MALTIDERVADEIEALEAILLDDVVIKRSGEVPEFIETVVHPSTADDVDQQFVCVTLQVKLIPGYPDCSPEVTLRNPRGLDDTILGVINSQIKEKLEECLGQPVVFELIELVRENLTESNLPSGQCAICLYGFAEGDVFIKTQCYHHFHSQCLAKHLIAGKKNYKEEFDKLPNWQQAQAPPYQQTCPVCRAPVECDMDSLKHAPPPIESVTAPPFRLTAELKDLQLKMAALLAEQIAKGGVVGMGDTGPPPLTITGPDDEVFQQEESTSANGVSSDPKTEPVVNGRPNGNSSQDSHNATSPQHHRSGKGSYRGFNRRGKPGRRGRFQR